jgi:hypothetical protein
MGIDHFVKNPFVKNHFVEIHKVDRKFDVLSLRRNYFAENFQYFKWPVYVFG